MCTICMLSAQSVQKRTSDPLELNSGSLQKQQVLVTAEPTLQLSIVFFFPNTGEVEVIKKIQYNII